MGWASSLAISMPQTSNLVKKDMFWPSHGMACMINKIVLLNYYLFPPMRTISTVVKQIMTAATAADLNPWILSASDSKFPHRSEKGCGSAPNKARSPTKGMINRCTITQNPAALLGGG